jgi:phage recombination protein Bet
MNEIAKIDYSSKEIIETLQKTVASGLNKEEFMLFAELCKSTGLNPFKKEIWAIKAGGRLQLMTGVNGYWAIANAHPMFDGTEQDIEVDKEGHPVKATCKVYRKDRKFPSVAIALMKEYRKSSPIWSQMPSVMLMKCAESVALRKAFPQELNGLYTQEEMPPEYTVKTPEKVTPAIKIDTMKYQYKLEVLKVMSERGDAMTSWKEAVDEYGATKNGEFAYSTKEIPTWKSAAVALPQTPLEEDDIPEVFKQEEKA